MNISHNFKSFHSICLLKKCVPSSHNIQYVRWQVELEWLWIDVSFLFESWSAIAFSRHSFLCVTFFVVISLQVLPHAHLSKLSRAKCQERFVSSPRGAPVCERPVERLNVVFTYFNYPSFLCFGTILSLAFFQNCVTLTENNNSSEI